MSTGVVLAVLLGALVHAAWNALVKSSGDKASHSFTYNELLIAVGYRF